MSTYGFLKIKSLGTASTNVIVDNNATNVISVSSVSEQQPLYFIDSNGNVNTTKFLNAVVSGRGSKTKCTVNVDSDCNFSLDHPFIFAFGEPGEAEVDYKEFDTFLSEIPADSEAKNDANIIQEYIQQFIKTEPTGPAELKQIAGVISVNQFISETVEDKVVYKIICKTIRSSDNYGLNDLTVGNEIVVSSTDEKGNNRFIKYKITNIDSEGRGQDATFTLYFDPIEGYVPNVKQGQNIMVVFSSKNNFIYLPVTSDGISTDDIVKARNQNLFDFDDTLEKRLDNIIKNIANVMFEIENIKSTNLKDYNILLNYINKNIENLNSKLDSIENKSNLNTENIEKLNSKVSANTAEIASLNSTVKGINTTVSDYGTRITLLSKNVESNADDITLLNSKALGHDVAISNLNNDKLSGKEAQEIPESSKENELYFIESTPSVKF